MTVYEFVDMFSKYPRFQGHGGNKKEDAENTEGQTSALLISKDTRSGNKEYVLDNKCRYKRDDSDDKKAKGGTNGTAKTKQKDIQYSQRGTFINPLTPVVMTLAFRDDRTRGFAVVAREGSSRSTVFHLLHNVHVNCIKISD